MSQCIAFCVQAKQRQKKKSAVRYSKILISCIDPEFHTGASLAVNIIHLEDIWLGFLVNADVDNYRLQDGMMQCCSGIEIKLLLYCREAIQFVIILNPITEIL